MDPIPSSSLWQDISDGSWPFLQTEDFNYALIKWESLHRNGVRSLPPYPSILNQQLSGSLWIKDTAIYQQQHTDSPQVRPMGDHPAPSVPHAQAPPKKKKKKREKIQGLLRIMHFSGTMKVSVPTSCHSCLLSKRHLVCADNTMEARGWHIDCVSRRKGCTKAHRNSPDVCAHVPMWEWWLLFIVI